jgi:agmatine deiminase
MIADLQANVVSISDLLEGRFPTLVDGLRRILADREVPLRIIRGTRDLWVRDFLPVQVAPDEFVRFRYNPDYLRGYEELKTLPGHIEPISEIGRCVDSEIVLDGGNVVRWGGRCIVTDKVFRENPGMGKDDLSGKIRELLRVEELIVIPKEPYDVVGHADGVVRFLDEGLVAINDYSKVAPWYGRRLKSILRRAKLEWVELPYRPEEVSGGDIPSAVGCYANFLMVRGLVVVLRFGRPEDDLACRVIEENTNSMAIVSLDCSDLAREGGVLNCVTWTTSSGRRPVESRTQTENERE